ncbi:hypothetical protein GQ55_6G092300 [Panicum hallii var. hallii]|uniref:Uncharacterized protein n=1 Tax=Panicum hallii var. hallii TaxID=1504633 RepID=A0A2T7D5D9_9POAL|nr:hypothetical protein GQ55_6G092300 [Panicum hallii var. hallii]
MQLDAAARCSPARRLNHARGPLSRRRLRLPPPRDVAAVAELRLEVPLGHRAGLGGSPAGEEPRTRHRSLAPAHGRDISVVGQARGASGAGNQRGGAAGTVRAAACTTGTGAAGKARRRRARPAWVRHGGSLRSGGAPRCLPASASAPAGPRTEAAGRPWRRVEDQGEGKEHGRRRELGSARASGERLES